MKASSKNTNFRLFTALILLVAAPIAANAQMPFNVDPQKDKLYLALSPGSVSSVSLQLVYADGTQSASRPYRPCEDAGEATCGVLVE